MCKNVSVENILIWNTFVSNFFWLVWFGSVGLHRIAGTHSNTFYIVDLDVFAVHCSLFHCSWFWFCIVFGVFNLIATIHLETVLLCVLKVNGIRPTLCIHKNVRFATWLWWITSRKILFQSFSPDYLQLIINVIHQATCIVHILVDRIGEIPSFRFEFGWFFFFKKIAQRSFCRWQFISMNLPT